MAPERVARDWRGQDQDGALRSDGDKHEIGVVVGRTLRELISVRLEGGPTVTVRIPAEQGARLDLGTRVRLTIDSVGAPINVEPQEDERPRK
jgi:hypothetical protein